MHALSTVSFTKQHTPSYPRASSAVSAVSLSQRI